MPDQPKTPIRGVRIADALWHAVKDKAAEEGVSASELVREGLEWRITQPPPQTR